ncbi:Secreted protein [Rhodanobacter sp. Root179]
MNKTPMMARWAVLALVCSAPAYATATPVGETTAAADARFKNIYTTEWAWRTGQAGISASGESQPNNGRLDDVDAASQQRRLDYWQDVLKQLERVDVAALSPAEQVNFAIYREQIGNFVADQRFKNWQMPFNSDSAFWSDIGYQLGGGRLRTRQDYEQYLDRLDQIPAYFDQQIANMRAGLKRGFSVPRAVLDGRDVSIAAVAELKDPTASSFYAPFRQLPATMPTDEAQALQGQALRRLRDEVIPAYARLLAFFRNEYLPRARKTLAAEALPDGKAFYRQQIREYTTLDLSPDAIHQIGLDQVAQIHAQMLEVIKDTDFKGSFAEFLQFLRSDPQFYAKSPEELLMRSAWVAKEVDGQMARYFGHLPRQRFTIVPVPADIAPYYTSGRGGPDEYMVNTYDLPSRPLYNMPALTLHESYPGHALQLELADEQHGQPAFRRNSYISAYGEGWGLYSEYLGNEMGIYKTPYQRFGYLTYQMWRACRLVVDTGIHHLGWSRQQAIDYLTVNTALSAREIANEVDRYISWPGQALSYELGYLKIRELRAKAEQALGAKFDIRHFHDTVLSTGSVPLPVLEQRIDRFIADGGPEPDYGCDCAAKAKEQPSGP